MTLPASSHTAEELARQLLHRMEVPGALGFSAGNVVELANLIDEYRTLQEYYSPLIRRGGTADSEGNYWVSRAGGPWGLTYLLEGHEFADSTCWSGPVQCPFPVVQQSDYEWEEEMHL